SNVVGHTVDAADIDSVVAFVSKHERVDHLFFTAASGELGTFENQTISEAKLYFERYFWGSYAAARTALPLMPEQGSITFLSGGYAVRPQAGRTMVAVAQSAIEGLMRALAVELAPIRVNVISPGLIDTPLWGGMDEATRNELFNTEAQRLPARRIGQPSDVGQAFLYLATQGYTTGTVLSLNGGWNLV
ncbi:MAG: SDR family oxidoreductase, partial [Verrucomicrobiota bacterium]